MMLNFVVWLVAGALIGGLASLWMRTDENEGSLLNVGVGVVGAALSGALVSPLIGVGTLHQGAFSLEALTVSLLGAAILLAVVSVVLQESPR